jgi:transcriptional regulator with XRE-family HTH domain
MSKIKESRLSDCPRVHTDSTVQPSNVLLENGILSELNEIKRENLGPILYQFRTQRNLSQLDVGKLSGKPHYHTLVSKWERNIRFPTIQSLREYATILHLTKEEQEFLISAAGYPVDPLPYGEDFVKLHQSLLNPLLGKKVRQTILKQLLALSELAESAITLEQKRLAVDRFDVGSKGDPAGKP